MKPAALADLLLPGSGLFIDGRPAWGVPLLVPAVLLLAAFLLAALLGGFASDWILPRGLPVYALLSLLALGCRWHLARRARVDPARVRELARTASRAWLRADADAPARAAALVAAAPELAQAWRLHGRITGDPRSPKRADAIEAR